MNAICITCGTQFADSPDVPQACPICEDERQYVGLNGQQWTTLDRLRGDYRVVIEEEELNLTSFRIEPHFAIGQRASSFKLTLEICSGIASVFSTTCRSRESDNLAAFK